MSDVQALTAILEARCMALQLRIAAAEQNKAVRRSEIDDVLQLVSSGAVMSRDESFAHAASELKTALSDSSQIADVSRAKHRAPSSRTQSSAVIPRSSSLKSSATSAKLSAPQLAAGLAKEKPKHSSQQTKPDDARHEPSHSHANPSSSAPSSSAPSSSSTSIPDHASLPHASASGVSHTTAHPLPSPALTQEGRRVFNSFFGAHGPPPGLDVAKSIQGCQAIMTSAAMVALQDSIAKEELQDPGETRLSMSTLQVVLASIAMCADESVLALTRAAREEVMRPGGNWIADGDNLDANFSGYWQRQQRMFDIGLTRSVHFMADMERHHGKKMRGITGEDVDEFIRRRASAIAMAHAAVVDDDGGGAALLSTDARAAAKMRDLQLLSWARVAQTGGGLPRFAMQQGEDEE